MTPRQVLLDALAGRPTARPAVLCPGGMMSMAVADVMQKTGVAWPDAHHSPDAMLRLALAMQASSGFDNLALPFCMTVEAEAYGAVVHLGDAATQPRVRGFVLDLLSPAELPRPDFTAGRAGMLLEALRAAKAARPDVALVGNLVGPVSLLGMLGDPLNVLRWLRRKPDVILGFLDRISDDLAVFGRLQIEAGCDALCIAEPTGTGEILGSTHFRAAALPCLNRMADTVRVAGVPVIVHICGNVSSIDAELRELRAEAVSFDSVADIVAIHRSRPPWQVMGNVSPFLLETGPAEAVGKRTRRLVEGGIRLLAPACGVIPSTPIANLRAMADAARG